MKEDIVEKCVSAAKSLSREKDYLNCMINMECLTCVWNALRNRSRFIIFLKWFLIKINKFYKQKLWIFFLKKKHKSKEIFQL